MKYPDINMKDSSNYFNQLQMQIERAIKENRAIDKFVREQISLLEEAHDEFINAAQAKGYDLNSLSVGEIEIKQFASMRDLAKKIGIPTDKYDQKIKEIQIRFFGEDGFKRFFKS